MTEHLINKYKRRLESVILIPAGDGEFDVRLNGEMVYSKLITNVFPEHDTITAEIDKRL